MRLVCIYTITIEQKVKTVIPSASSVCNKKNPYIAELQHRIVTKSEY